MSIKAVKIEIELEQPKVGAPPPALQIRLVGNSAQLTLDAISEKLEKAMAKREQNRQKN